MQDIFRLFLFAFFSFVESFVVEQGTFFSIHFSMSGEIYIYVDIFWGHC